MFFMDLPFVTYAIKMVRFGKYSCEVATTAQTVFSNVILFKKRKYCLEKQPPGEHGILQVEENPPTDSTQS